MQSTNLLSELEQIPLCVEHERYTYEGVVKQSELMRNDLFAIEVAAGVEDTFSTLFDARNIPDDLFKAYKDAFPNISNDHSLYERYVLMVGRGENSVGSFISNIKGKLGELRIQELLKQDFPGYSFEIAKKQNQPIWDILATSPDGTVVQIQVKIGGEEYAGNVLARMQENPDVLFAVSNEIRAKILAEHPELADRFIDLDLSNFEFIAEIEEKLDLLVANMGIDVPDEVGSILPYVTEIVLGIRLLWDIVKTERDFETVAMDDKKRVHAMKALVLFQRFGISVVLTKAGEVAGDSVAPGGGFIGGIAGASLAGILNHKLRPRLLEIGMKLTRVTEDDLFYFRNKVAIDRIGESFVKTAASV